MLDASLASGYLTTVIAPAGFGKTTLVSSWIEQVAAAARPGIVPVPAAWLTLGAGENSPSEFLRYVIAALRTVFPQAAPETSQLVHSRQNPPPSFLADTLSNEIERLQSNFIIVLDDTHTVRNQGVFEILERWMHHWPWPMHLMLISRLNPPLPLANWRARGTVMELRSRDLRFTEEESAAFLHRTLGRQVEPATVSRLHGQMEGWVAGLRMATLAMGEGSDLPALPPDSFGTDIHLTSYLVEEGFLNLPVAIRQFLLTISVARQFCESLCQALADDKAPAGSIRQSLDYLITNELFLTVLDDREHWYRLHHLFRELILGWLQRDRGRNEVARLHRRAAQWYAAHELIDEALFHAREAADASLMREIMRQGLRDLLNREDRPTLERWLAMLPEETIEQDPEMAIMSAWKHGLRWELGNVERTVNRVAELLDAAPPNGSGSADSHLLRGHLAVLQAHVAFNSDRPEQAVTHSLNGLALMPESWRYVRGVAAVYLGLGLQASGRAEEAEQALTSRYEALPDKTDSYALRLLLGLAFIALQSGNLESALRIAHRIRGQSVESDLSVIQGWGHHLLGYTHYQRGELDAAETHFAKVTKMRFRVQLLTARSAMAGLAFTYQAQGRSEPALAQLDELSQDDLLLYGREQPFTAAARAWIYYRQGDLDRADTWSQGMSVLLPDQPLFLSDWVLLTRVGVLIARKTGRDIQLALEMLDGLDDMAARTFNKSITLVTLAWRALAELARGEIAAAQKALIRSVELARHTGQRQIYADLGGPMQQLLGQIAGEPSVAATVRDIRAVLERNGAPAHTGNGSAAAGYTMSESITGRELQILILMAEPISFDDISQQLHIAPSTTKRHSINLYGKLGVHSRWEAVARGIELGILPSR